MLRVILIVFVGFALSACRSGDEVSSTGGKSNVNYQVAGNNVMQAPTKVPETISTGEKTLQQKKTNTTPVYTPQPAAPLDPTEPVQVLSVTLEWTIPLQRENGDLLGANDLDGYIIELIDQSDPDAVDQAYVEGGEASSHSFDLPPGSYRFRVIAVDSNGLMSNPSDWVNADLA